MTFPSARITLLKNIAAIQIESTADGKLRCGLISRLPKGAEVSICGNGFNARTVKIECHGQFYFAFLQDIEEPGQYGAAITA